MLYYIILFYIMPLLWGLGFILLVYVKFGVVLYLVLGLYIFVCYMWGFGVIVYSHEMEYVLALCNRVTS